ncbi:hypothetical protein HUG10_21595 (plasmid) [Halorarum halophilum]|uniref:Phage protein Gp138 N-terminal domain-containing protein n=1 Tax=Halorarum halophilum TaxID=2743090 RepID=A0A7D5GF12_9EURY|nr:hypothetical protein [Halobaculum halophilum]QLG30185.1 hypothetical protein HUG10_21595 [Halobaculum halophilum]
MTTNIPALIREYIQDELRGVYTVSMVVLESVDMDAMRCTVSLKRDQDVIVDNVPIASTFARSDGYGIVVPVEPGETEGFILHVKEPLEDLIVDSGHQEITQQRQFSPVDAVFFPTIWNANDTTPAQNVGDYEQGEYLLAHPSDSLIRVKPDGRVIIEDSNGQTWTMDATTNETRFEHPSGPTLTIKNGEIDIEATQVKIGDLAQAVAVAVQQHTHNLRRCDGSTVDTDEPNEDGTDTLIS